jgi:hypothetical protein
MVRPGDRCGHALAAGAATGDGSGDLVIGTPGGSVGNDADAGSVAILRGEVESGVVAAGDLLIHELAWFVLPITW